MKSRSQFAASRAYPAVFVFPAAAVFLLLFVTPTITSFYYGLTDWNIHARETSFVGIENFRELFSDVKLVTALRNTIVFAVSVTVLRNLVGLALALMLNSGIRGRNLLRTIFFTPHVIAPIVIGYLFAALYHPAHGLVNQALRTVGLSALAVDWLNDARYALSSVIMTDVWRTSGFAMVIYLAGLQIIPLELYETANLDGAGGWSKFIHVTFPLLAPSFTVNLVLSIIGTMKVFVMILVLTNGGPGYTTEVINTYIMSAFSLGLYGYATAANLMLFLLITGIGLPLLYLLRKREVEL
jgi:raffinose/stachyose/melibiose transport system permease protein